MSTLVLPCTRTCDRIVSLVTRGLSAPASFDEPSFDALRKAAFECKDAASFASYYLSNQVVSKWGDGASAELRASALEKFHEAEAVCRESTPRILRLEGGPLGVFIRRAQLAVRRVLGDFPWESFPRECRFGPGASVGLRKANASHQNKWARSAHVTKKAIPYLTAFTRWSGFDELDPGRTFQVCAGNKVTTVPKNWKTDRTIAIEPDWNMFFQLGVGGLIRRRLQRFGLLKPDAQQLHRDLAALASRLGHLATLDLSMASDTVSLALCELLLPPDWWKVISDLRSEVGELPDGSAILYEKVSSMGNGFTFELETLIFYALARSVQEADGVRNVSVYGDDIIVPTESAADVITLLQECGFRVNTEKSFSSGPFRESCGGHYFDGVDVAPFYLRGKPRTIGDLIVLGNHLQSRPWLSQNPDIRRAFGLIRSVIPRGLYGPRGLPGVLWAPWDRSSPKWSARYQRYSQQSVVRVHRYVDLTDFTGAYLHKLWSNGPDPQSRLARATSRERLQVVTVDRDHWFPFQGQLWG